MEEDISQGYAEAQYVDSSYASRAPDTSTRLPLELRNSVALSAQSRITALDFTNALRDLHVPGPLDLVENIKDPPLASGGQFAVYKSEITGWWQDQPWLLLAVIVKRCHIKLAEGEILDLTAPQTRRQVQNMYLEVLALQEDSLRRHRNVANMIGWTHDQSSNAMPLLIMEPALGDLRNFLTANGEPATGIKHQLCLDMCAGLAALHKAGIVHADLKPPNILVFENEPDGVQSVPFIARLADFGFSAAGLGSTIDGLMVEGWTDGWQAPEINQALAHGTRLSMLQYYLADRYSLGLVIWSVFCSHCSSLPDNTSKDASKRAIASLGELVPSPICDTLTAGLKTLLAFDPELRNCDLESLLHDDSSSFQSWIEDCRLKESWQQEYPEQIGQEAEDTPFQESSTDSPKYMPKPIGRFLLQGLDKSLRDFGENMSGGELFSIFLTKSYSAIWAKEMKFESSLIQSLLLAAEKEFLPAQAVINRVFASHGVDWPDELHGNRIDWLQRGGETGCKIARKDLLALDPARAKEAQLRFCQQGGYLQTFFPPEDRAQWKAFGGTRHTGSTLEQIGAALQSLSIQDSASQQLPQDPASQQIAENSASQQDLLYLACAAGETDAVLEMLSQGIRAATWHSPAHITCLHWLHSFPTGDAERVAQALIANGGDVNAPLETTNPLLNIHHPYTLPPGTPLHWAVAASNIEATIALLKNGAYLSTRNGQDSYMYNGDVRYLVLHSQEFNIADFSEPTEQCTGVTALDLAVANRDFQLLRAILDLKGKDEISINQADEEGYTPFHRLAQDCVGLGATGIRYGRPSFAGSGQNELSTDARETVKVLLEMGGDINQLTKLCPSNQQKTALPGNMTPLMLAVRFMDLVALQALLEFGADVNVRNEHGVNCLSLLEGPRAPVPFHLANTIIKLLINSKVELPSPSECLYQHDPLNCVMASQDMGLVRVILSAGVDTGPVWGFSRSAALMAHGSLEQSILMRGGDLAEWAARDVAVSAIIADFFADKEDLNSVDPCDGNLLHYAVGLGYMETAKYLLSLGLDPNACRKKLQKADEQTHMLTGLKLPPGTALDICIARLSGVEKDGSQDYYGVKPELYICVLDCYKKIKALLENSGGKTSNS